MAKRRIEHAAEKKQILTLDQVAAFVQDAMRSGANGSEPIEATVSIGGKLQKLAISFEAGSVRDTTPTDKPAY